MSNTTRTSETQIRSLAKGVSYRFCGTLMTMVVGFVMTGSARATLVLGSFDVTTKLLLFWGHERIWNRIIWGRRAESVISQRVRSAPSVVVHVSERSAPASTQPWTSKVEG